MTWWRRLLRQRALERELDAELRDHIEREVADRVRAGESDAEARRQMRLSSGGLDQLKEVCRDVRRPPALADIAADVRFAWRILMRNGWATAGAVLTLALAMGVANATFISTYAALWRDFPFERPDRIAIMRTLDGRGREAGLSFPDFEDWRRDTRVFDGPAAAFAITTIGLGRDGATPEQFDGLYVSAATFSVLRVKPRLGRDFSAADDRPGAEPVVIISSNIWKSRYAASRDVVGRTITVNGALPATIIGVMPDGIRFIDFTDVWLPLAQMPGLTAQRRDSRPLMMIGRLPDGADLDRVRADLSPIAANLAVTHPDTNKDIRPLANTLLEAYNGGVSLTESSVLLPLLAAAFVLLIAAANLANLLLARAAYRSREIAIRLAIGATQWRIVRGLLIESLLLAAVAWILAVGGSWLALTYLGVPGRSAFTLLAPQDGRPPAGHAGGDRAHHHGTLRPRARDIRLASRDRRWTQGRRSSEHTAERPALDPCAARRAVRRHAGAPERCRAGGQTVLRFLCGRSQRADVGYGDHIHSTTGPDLRDA